MPTGAERDAQAPRSPRSDIRRLPREVVHLPGAEKIPRSELARLAPEPIERDETVVVYCASLDCQESARAARPLEHLGYREVYDFEGGIAEWRRCGLPVVLPERLAVRR